MRDRLVLSMIDSELTAEAMQLTVMSSLTIMAPHADPKKLSSLWDDTRRRLDFIANRREMGNMRFRTAEEELADVSASAIRTFEELRKSGVLELFDKKVAEIDNRLESER